MKSKFQVAHTKAKRVTVDCGEGLTEQSHKQECDINHILKEYTKTAIIRHTAKYEGAYDDVPSIDFQEAMLTIKRAEQLFNELPSAIRKRFNGQPADFLAFVENPDNKDEIAKLGLTKGVDGIRGDGSPVAKTPTKAEPATTPEPAATPEPPQEPQAAQYIQ